MSDDKRVSRHGSARDHADHEFEKARSGILERVVVTVSMRRSLGSVSVMRYSVAIFSVRSARECSAWTRAVVASGRQRSRAEVKAYLWKACETCRITYSDIALTKTVFEAAYRTYPRFASPSASSR